MADKNIQMTQRNTANTGWDNLFPITKAVNVNGIASGKQSILGNGTVSLSANITFPKAFSEPPTMVGNDLKGASANVGFTNITTTGCTLHAFRVAAGTFASGGDYEFSWLAIGK
nr:hypothetical protein [Fredinandcohnia onubensis]